MDFFKLFKTDISTVELLSKYGWVKISDCLYSKEHYEIDLSDEHRQWRLIDTRSGASLSGTYENLESALNLVKSV